MNLDSNTLVLQEEVAVSPPFGERLAAPVAVLADQHDGVYFPSGYWRGAPENTQCRVSIVFSPQLDSVQELRRVCGAPTHQSTFFVLDGEGALRAAPIIPAIEYDDFVETRERVVVAHFLDLVPSDWKPLLAAVLLPPVPLRVLSGESIPPR